MATKAAQLIDVRYRRSWVVAALLLVSLPVSAAEFAAEVYRDDSMTIQAGLQGSSSQVVHFGDALVLIIALSYDADKVSFQELDATLFTSAWPVANGAQLIDWQTQRGVNRELGQETIYVTYRFQILGCPDADTPTCPGDRSYVLPEFVLDVEDLIGGDDSARSIRFRPWPETLRVSTTLQNDEDDQLLPFKAYFPAGGYPEPMVGEAGLRQSFVTAGISLALLIGGLLMWPFRSRTQEKTVVDQPRWQQQLQILDETLSEDDVRYADTLRRCLVWYCNDELRLDPFVWLDLAESGDASGDGQNNVALRSLFIDLLHSPTGLGGEFRQRLESIISPEDAK